MQGQAYRHKAKTENVIVNFLANATINPVFQFWVIFAILQKTCNNIIMMMMVDKYLTSEMFEFKALS